MRKGGSHAQKNTYPNSHPKNTFPLGHQVEPSLDWKQTTNNRPNHNKPQVIRLHYQRRPLTNNFITLIIIQLESSKARKMPVSVKTPDARVLGRF